MTGILHVRRTQRISDLEQDDASDSARRAAILHRHGEGRPCAGGGRRNDLVPGQRHTNPRDRVVQVRQYIHCVAVTQQPKVRRDIN